MNHDHFIELYDFAREMQLLSWKLWTIRAYDRASPPEFFPDLSGVVGDATPLEDLLALFSGRKDTDGLAFFRDTFRKQGAFDPAVAIEELMIAIREKSWTGLLLSKQRWSRSGYEIVVGPTGVMLRKVDKVEANGGSDG
jgi:hypothetical protein